MKKLLLLIALVSQCHLYAQTELFLFSENQKMLDFKLLHHVFKPNQLPLDTTLFGQLIKDSKTVTFYFFQPEARGVNKIKIEIDPYAFKLANGEHWGYLQAPLSNMSYEKLQSSNFTIVANTQQIISMSLSAGLSWFKDNLPKFDQNKFKETQRYKKAAMDHLQNVDLNNTPFKTSTELTFIDLQSGLVGYNLGKSILYEGENRSDYLSFHLIYDFRRKEVRQVYVHNTGFFLE